MDDRIRANIFITPVTDLHKGDTILTSRSVVASIGNIIKTQDGPNGRTFHLYLDVGEYMCLHDTDEVLVVE